MSSIFQKPPNNYQYKVGVPNFVDYNVTSNSVTGVGNVITGNLIWPGNILIQDGQRLMARWIGTVQNAVGNRTIEVLVDAATVMTLNWTAVEMPPGGWIVETEFTLDGNILEMLTKSSALLANSIAINVAQVQKNGRSAILTSTINPLLSHLLQLRLTASGAGDILGFSYGNLYIF